MEQWQRRATEFTVCDKSISAAVNSCLLSDSSGVTASRKETAALFAEYPGYFSSAVPIFTFTRF
jgi:hypothetical protein